MNKELEYYNKTKNWDFSMINYEKEILTKWDMWTLLKDSATKDSKILDLGTGGGENVIKHFPEVKEIIATDFSPEMIKTANKNLEASGRKNIIFRVMDNLKMDTPDNYFDIVNARHTCTDAKQIYKTLKKGGKLILRGVDKMDCWDLKKMCKQGQAFKDSKPISVIDFENIIDAGFKDAELVPICVREYYKTKEDLYALLYKVPILDDFSEIDSNKLFEHGNFDINIIEKYIKENTYKKGILLRRRYYGITATK